MATLIISTSIRPDWVIGVPGDMVIRVILMILSDAPPHDPEPYTNYVLSDIITAATGENPIHIIPVVIRDDPTAVSLL